MIEPKSIGAIVSVLVLIAIAFFIVSMVSVQPELNPESYNKIFPVYDSSVNQSFDIKTPYLENIHAEKWSGVEWQPINDQYIRYVGSNVLINHEGLD